MQARADEHICLQQLVNESGVFIMARANDYEYTKLKGSPGSGKTGDSSGPKDTNIIRTGKREANYCGRMDSRPENSDRRQSAR